MPKKSYVRKRRYQVEMKRHAQAGRINREDGTMVNEATFRVLPAKSDTTFHHYMAGHKRG